MGFQERLSECCHSSDMMAKEERIRDVEHVAALSGASGLGSDMMRARDYDPKALRRAILILASKVRQDMRLGMGPSQQLATAAILEVMHWQCRTCNGAAEQIIGGVRQVCPTCGGTGVHRWLDTDRAKATGYPLANWSMWAKKYERVIAIARRFDSSTVHLSHKRMG